VLRHVIARTRGDLGRQSLLAELAYQFGQAIGHYGALRSALGRVDPETKKWIPEDPDPAKLLTTTEPHARGAILVAAIFEAFLIIYQRRAADLLRIATGGTGVLPPGDIHPDLVERLSQEAAKTARHILQMCIRALDYCPPVDVDFGDYFRALITADADLVTDDRLNYRLALCEAFRRRGIYPRDVRSLSIESLLWDEPTAEQQKAFGRVFHDDGTMRGLAARWGLISERKEIYQQAQRSQTRVHRRFSALVADSADEANCLFLDEHAPLYLNPDAPHGYYRPGDRAQGPPAFEVHSVRPVRRIGPDGGTLAQFVIELTQRRRGYFDPADQAKADGGDPELLRNPDFVFRGGCTLLVVPETGQVRYCIYKRIASEYRLERTRRYLTGEQRPSLRATYFGDPRRKYSAHLVSEVEGLDGEEQARVEPFALLHHSLEDEEEVA